MFWVSMVSGWYFIEYMCETVSYALGLPLIISHFVLTAVVLRKFNPVKLNEENIFVNSQGEKLDNRYPTFFGSLSSLNIIFCIWFFTTLYKPIFGEDSLAAFVGIIFILPTLYFIYKNCPISIIFYSKAWNLTVLGWEPSTITNTDPHFSSSNSSTISSYDSQRHSYDYSPLSTRSRYK